MKEGKINSDLGNPKEINNWRSDNMSNWDKDGLDGILTIMGDVSLSSSRRQWRDGSNLLDAAVHGIVMSRDMT